MKCCVNCFRDTDIRERIVSLNEKGSCDFCDMQNVYIMDLEKASTQEEYAKGLVLVFETLIEQFTTHFQKEYFDQASKLADFLEKNTRIFCMDASNISKFLKMILPQVYADKQALFDGLVIPTYLKDPQQVSQNGIFKGESWQAFQNDIRYNNRFHSTMVNEKILLDFFDACKISIGKGKRLYRARISENESPLLDHQMWAAPKGQASPRRLNASGIGYLYLSEDSNAALEEIKPAVNDVCTIATFEVIADKKCALRVVDLGQISNISIFTSEVSRYLMNQNILSKIDLAMRKTSKRNRSEVKYAPTEYMSDLIKSMDVDGIRYKSTLSPDVNNIVLFNENADGHSKIKQINSELKTVKISKLHYEKVIM